MLVNSAASYDHRSSEKNEDTLFHSQLCPLSAWSDDRSLLCFAVPSVLTRLLESWELFCGFTHQLSESQTSLTLSMSLL